MLNVILEPESAASSYLRGTAMTTWLEPALEWSMGAFGGGIEWADCASSNPVEWHPTDLEIFYSLGRCHHLAMALRILEKHRIGVLFETDPNSVHDSGLPVPHHVFAILQDGQALDIRGIRSINDIVEHFSLSVGLVSPQVTIYPSIGSFRRHVMERGDNCLRPDTNDDIAAAKAVITHRFPDLFADIRRINEENLGVSFGASGLRG